MKGSIAVAALSPHPPIIIPEVGGRDGEKAAATIEGCRKMASLVAEARPEALIMVTPHGLVMRDAISISFEQPLVGDLGSFGAPAVSFRLENDASLARLILEEAKARGIPVVPLGQDDHVRSGRGAGLHWVGRRRSGLGLDHGLMVPLYYLKHAGVGCPLVVVNMGILEYEDLYEFGKCVQAAVARSGKRCAFIASGDLSHRLTPDAPAGFSRQGAVFDSRVVDALRVADIRRLLEIDEDTIENAGECGFRPIVIMLGALDGLKVTPEVLSYEGPFGVGYCVAVFSVAGEDPGRKAAIGRERLSRENEDPYVRLARMSLETYVRTGRVMEAPPDLPHEMRKKAAAFVSLKKRGRLRGCIGTIEPVQVDLAHEIIRNAISAGTEDPRFEPVSESELDEIVYSVDILSEPEPVGDVGSLDPRVYGVIVEKGYRRGLLLPDLEGIDTVEQQLAIAAQKAGLRPNDKGLRIYRFTVERHR